MSALLATPAFRVACAAAAFVGFCASLAVHVAALLGHDFGDRFAQVMLLHLGIFAVFLPMVVAERQQAREGERADLRRAFEHAPRPVVWLGVFLGVYLFVNFGLFIASGYEGGPSIVDGHYALVVHGRFVRELTAAQYVAARAHELRGFSGHWMVFYYVPFAYFAFARDRADSTA